ncbi:hypothetical protein ACJX0J_007932, partial [Zea mays]
WELASVLKDTKERFDSAGVKLIAVGVGTPAKASILAEERLPFPLEYLYADPDRKFSKWRSNVGRSARRSPLPITAIHLLLGIPDLLNQPNMSILKQLLQTLQPTENFDDVLSKFQSSLGPCNVDYLYCGACKMLEDIMDSAHKLLSADFPSEDVGKDGRGDLIQKILQIYLRNSDSTSDLLAKI